MKNYHKPVVCKHSKTFNVCEASEALALKAAPQVCNQDLDSLENPDLLQYVMSNKKVTARHTNRFRDQHSVYSSHCYPNLSVIVCKIPESGKVFQYQCDKSLRTRR